MDLERRLAEDKAELVQGWFGLILSTYPPETRRIWAADKDQFSNPVGSITRTACEALWDLILDWTDAEGMARHLESIIKIRAVQNFTPSQALSFVFLLKKLLREKYLPELSRSGGVEQLLKFETRIDNLALMSVDIYSKSRETIFQMRVDEVKMSQYKLLQKARMIVGDSANEAEQ